MLWIFERCWLFLRFKINVEDLGGIHDNSNTPILGDVAERRFHLFLIDDTVPLSVCPLCSRIVLKRQKISTPFLLQQQQSRVSPRSGHIKLWLTFVYQFLPKFFPKVTCP